MLTTQQKFLQKNKDIFLKYVDESKFFSHSVVYDNLVLNDPKKLIGIINQNSAFSSKAWAQEYFKEQK